jgi:vibriolysin
VAPHPSAHVALDSGWILSGGGALDNWTGAGNLLTASYPNGAAWFASGKDHIEASPAAITAYVIGLKEV